MNIQIQIDQAQRSCSFSQGNYLKERVCDKEVENVIQAFPYIFSMFKQPQV